jgi:MFS transporter, DHA1 family, inner membrane transport protein
MPDLATRDKPSRALPRGFGALVGARLLTNITIRLVFPFLPQIARGLGTTVDGMGATLAASQLGALGQLLLGRVVHRIGVRTALIGGLSVLALVAVMASASTSLVWFGVCLAAILLAKGLYDVASTTWIGERVPVERRGRAIGLIETSWAGAFFLGMPLVALIIRAGTWRTPYLVIAGALGIAALVVASQVPPVRERADDSRVGLRPDLAMVAALSTPFLFSAGLYTLLVSFATWLEDSHGVSIEGLGIAAFAVGLGELCGSSSCAVLADHLGPIKAMRFGIALIIPATLALPLGAEALPLALVLLFAWFALFEFSYVTLLSWLTELQPDARATTASFTFASFSGGGLVGSLVGSRLIDGPGMVAVAIVMSAMYAGAFLLTTVFAGPRTAQVPA